MHVTHFGLGGLPFRTRVHVNYRPLRGFFFLAFLVLICELRVTSYELRITVRFSGSGVVYTRIYFLARELIVGHPSLLASLTVGASKCRQQASVVSKQVSSASKCRTEEMP
jgi:hypothetical protein